MQNELTTAQVETSQLNNPVITPDTPAKVAQELKNLGAEEREKYELIQLLDPLFSKSAAEQVEPVQVEKALTRAARYIADAKIAKYTAERVEKRVLADVTNLRWYADAALKALIGAVVVGTSSKVYGYARDNLFHKTSIDSGSNPFDSTDLHAPARASGFRTANGHADASL